MQRKKFLSSIIPLGAAVAAFRNVNVIQNTSSSKTPPYLSPGDTIGITSPAGYISLEDCRVAIRTIEGWGYKIRIGNTIGKKDFTFGGTDEERRADFQQLLDDDSVQAIMCARGGYGIIRMIDQLDFKKFLKKPKWIIGFSDATVLHSHINKNFGIATIHSKMCNSFVEPEKAETSQTETIRSIQTCLTGININYQAVPNRHNKKGIGDGLLIGGNLKTLETLSGTASDIDTANKILFVEDTGEYLYSIDRMFWNLKRTGKLNDLAGLIIGGFKVKQDDEGEEFGKTLEEIVLEKVKEYNYPVCFDFPVGHQKNNYALKCGTHHVLEVTDSIAQLNSLR